jgi:hypothetical protein
MSAWSYLLYSKSITCSVLCNRNQRKGETILLPTRVWPNPDTDWTYLLCPSESSDSPPRVRSAWKKRVGRRRADSDADAGPSGDPVAFWAPSCPALVSSEEEPRRPASPWAASRFVSVLFVFRLYDLQFQLRFYELQFHFVSALFVISSCSWKEPGNYSFSSVGVLNCSFSSVSLRVSVLFYTANNLEITHHHNLEITSIIQFTIAIEQPGYISAFIHQLKLKFDTDTSTKTEAEFRYRNLDTSVHSYIK